jgi:hypothetical protein
VATVWQVRDYRRVDLVAVGDGMVERVTAFERGLVVTGEWHATSARKRSDRRSPIELEWPVTDQEEILVVCPKDGYVPLLRTVVEAWAEDAEGKRQEVTRRVPPR